jgi:hypothetical protein
MGQARLQNDHLRFPIRGLLVVILAIDIVFVGLIPLWLELQYTHTDDILVMDAAIWYAPWNLFAGYFCFPIGIYAAPTYNVILIVVSLAVFISAKRHISLFPSLLMYLIAAQNILAVLGLVYLWMLSLENQSLFAPSDLVLIGTRTVWSVIIIGLNVWYFTHQKVSMKTTSEASHQAYKGAP